MSDADYQLSKGYHKILRLVEKLPPEDQLRLIHDITSVLQYRVVAKPLHNITEFRGMDKETWKDVDVEKYIDEERNSWERE